MLLLLLPPLLLLSCRLPAIACGTFQVGVAPTDVGQVSPLPAVGVDPWPWHGCYCCWIVVMCSRRCNTGPRSSTAYWVPRCLWERDALLNVCSCCWAIFHGFPADFVRCTAQGTWSRGRKITIPGVSIGKIAITRVLVTREFAGTRTSNTREFQSTIRTQ